MEALPHRVDKLAAAERQLVTAIRLFFQNGDAVSIHSLACNAREICERLCETAGTPRIFDQIKAAHSDLTPAQIWEVLNRYRNFFKHIGPGPDAVIEDFCDNFNDHALFLASYDFGQAFRALPVEAQVFQSWYAGVYQEHGRLGLAPDVVEYFFPRISQVPRYEQKRMGRDALLWASSEPSLRVPYQIPKEKSPAG